MYAYVCILSKKNNWLNKSKHLKVMSQQLSASSTTMQIFDKYHTIVCVFLENDNETNRKVFLMCMLWNLDEILLTFDRSIDKLTTI